MRIAACLVWFDETPASLERCVVSLAGLVDEVVAVDGRWDLMPGSDRYSPAEQGQAIEAAAQAVVLGCRVVQAPEEALVSQVAKRAFAMAAAAEASDWILVIDGDEYVESCDPDALRTALEAEGDQEVAAASVRTKGAGVRNRKRRPSPRAFRALPGLTVEGAHNGYRAGGRWLAGPNADDPALDVTDAVALVNDLDARTTGRRDAAGVYYGHRRYASHAEQAA